MPAKKQKKAGLYEEKNHSRNEHLKSERERENKVLLHAAALSQSPREAEAILCQLVPVVPKKRCTSEKTKMKSHRP